MGSQELGMTDQAYTHTHTHTNIYWVPIPASLLTLWVNLGRFLNRLEHQFPYLEFESSIIVLYLILQELNHPISLMSITESGFNQALSFVSTCTHMIS